MIKGIYAVKDSLTGVIGVNLEDNEEIARRNFTQGMYAMSKRDDFIGQCGDYDLYCIGSIDVESGVINTTDITHVLNGSRALSIAESGVNREPSN